MSKKRHGILLVLAMMLLLLGGCGEKTLPEIQREELPGRRESYQFIFVRPIVGNPYWVDCVEGMQKADEKLGTQTRVIGPQAADNFAAEIVGFMEQAVAEQPDGIILYAGIEALEPLIEQAIAQGIPVLALDSDAPGTSRTAYVGTDAYNMGCAAGETLIDLTGGTAKVGLLVSSKSAEKEMQVMDAFLDAVRDYNVEIVDMQETDADTDVAESKTREMLEQYPEMTAVFSTAGCNVTGAARVKEELGLDELVLIGFDDIEENLHYVRQGVIDAIFVQNIRDAGYQSVCLMKDCVDKGKLAKEYYDTGTTLVNRDNVDTYADEPEIFDTTPKTVRVGYYSGDQAFQDGFDESARKSGYAYEYYQAIADVTGWEYEYVYGSRSEMSDKLLKGEVDIMAGVHRSDYLQENVLFSDDDMGLDGIRRYFAITPGRKDLLRDLNYAMEQIDRFIPDYRITLSQKYYNPETEQMLTDAQAKWLREKGILRIGYVRQSLPLSDQDEDGNPIGVIRDLMDIISDYTGAELEAVAFDQIDDMESELQSGGIDAAFPVYSDLWLNESKGIRQTDSFVSDRVMMLYRGNYSADMMEKVALSETDLGIQYYLETAYPDSEVVFYGSRRETLEAVRTGEIRCAVGCASILQRMLQEYPDYQRLSVAYLDSAGEFGIAVRRDNTYLLNILNKTVRQMDKAAITGAMMKYSNVETTYSFQELMRQYFEYILLFLLAFVIFLIVIFSMYRRRTLLFNREQAKTQAALEKALEDANAANAAKTVFLSSMSHDIRTPMNAITGMTTIAQMNLDDREKVADCLGKIEVSGRHLLTLINNVLDISKIESHQLQLNPSLFSLRDKMEDLKHIVEPQVRGKHLDLETHMQLLEGWLIYADEVRINQVFMNLLTNAIKYTPDGGKVVVELTEKVLREGETARVTYSVADNGIGMSEEFMKNMYDTFTRAKDSRIDKIQGTGLGLAIVKQMVEMMEGAIECVSEENKGTKFTVTLDVPIQPVGEESTSEVSEKNAGEPFGENHFMAGRHLLIAEDNELNWEVISGILEMLKVKADWAENGKVCLDMLENAPDGTYDLVLMDIQMPVMNGREAAAAIRRSGRESVRNIPIIAMTADAFAEDIEASLAAGMNGHVSKPVDVNKMLQEMCRLLGGG